MIAIAVCIAAFIITSWLLRRDQMSFGIPLAYLGSLLLNHVPGAFVHTYGDSHLPGTEWVESGIVLTAIACVAFALGVSWACLRTPSQKVRQYRPDYRFWIFSLITGLGTVYGLGFLSGIPTIGAAINHAGALWMLGVMLGLRHSLRYGSIKWTAIWGLALAIYPILTLVFGGFLAAGTTAVIIVISALIVSVRSRIRLIVGVCTVVFIGLNIFVNYYVNRDNIRHVVWSSAGLESRIDAVSVILSEFEWIDFKNVRHELAFNERLNHNMFIGIAADRLNTGQVDYIYGRSIWEALLALVPRALWPDKSVFGGSGTIVADMTGLELNRNTSWGVGQVMEFYINFGIAGIVGGFIFLGWLIGTLDRKAAAAEARGDVRTTILLFLPVVALIQPIYSLVELTGGSVIALIAGWGWCWVWKVFANQGQDRFHLPSVNYRGSV